MLNVKNWRTFQHYKDRNPPWIKLHFSMLSSEDWVTLDDSARVLAIACMLVASKNEGQIDDSDKGLAYLKRVAYLNKTPNLKPLIECGFLESASDCKQMLADARPETETEVLTEKKELLAEGDKSPPASGSAKPDLGAVNGDAVIYIPLVGKDEWGVSKAFAAELADLYPSVDVPQTLREIRGWNIANPKLRKTAAGIKRHINQWCQKEQNRG